jgi:hypothetical protein
MSTKKPIPPGVLDAAAKKFAAGTATRRSLHAIGVPQRQYPAIATAADDELKRFRHALAGILGETAMDMALRLKAESGSMPVGQLAVPLGILVDKHKGLIDAGQPATQHLHLHLGSDDRTGAITALLGKHSERVAKPVAPAGEAL